MIEATDPKFDLDATRRFLETLESAGGVHRCGLRRDDAERELQNGRSRSLCVSASRCGRRGRVGCRQDMHDQPKYIPLRESTFFSDARSARPLWSGTVARGQLHEDALLYTGKVNGADATVFPFRGRRAR